MYIHICQSFVTAKCSSRVPYDIRFVPCVVEIAIVYVQSLRQPFGLVTFYVKRITVKEKFEMILNLLPKVFL